MQDCGNGTEAICSLWLWCYISLGLFSSAVIPSSFYHPWLLLLRSDTFLVYLELLAYVPQCQRRCGCSFSLWRWIPMGSMNSLVCQQGSFWDLHICSSPTSHCGVSLESLLSKYSRALLFTLLPPPPTTVLSSRVKKKDLRPAMTCSPWSFMKAKAVLCCETLIPSFPCSWVCGDG